MSLRAKRQIVLDRLRPLVQAADRGTVKPFAPGLLGNGCEGRGDVRQLALGGREARHEGVGLTGRKVHRDAAGTKRLNLVDTGVMDRLQPRHLGPQPPGVAFERARPHGVGEREAAPDESSRTGGGEQHALRHPAAPDVEQGQPPPEAGPRGGERVALGQMLVERLLDRPGVDEVPELLVHDLDLADRGLAVERFVLLQRGLPLVDDLCGVHYAQHFLRVQHSFRHVHCLLRGARAQCHPRLISSSAAVSYT